MAKSTIQFFLSQFRTPLLCLSLGLSLFVYSQPTDISSDSEKINSQKVLLQSETLTGTESIRTPHTLLLNFFVTFGNQYNVMPHFLLIVLGFTLKDYSNLCRLSKNFHKYTFVP